jgi:hypothetical protein
MFAQCGSRMVSQWRYALSRHSSSHRLILLRDEADDVPLAARSDVHVEVGDPAVLYSCCEPDGLFPLFMMASSWSKESRASGRREPP